MKHSFREGEFIETIEGLIFEVKGLVHPPNRVIAYLRYIPSSKGQRLRNRRKYLKIYSLKERQSFLMDNYPKYLFYDPHSRKVLQGVPFKDIKRIYIPCEKTLEILNKAVREKIEEIAVKFICAVADESGLKEGDLGITGSLLLGLEGETSDIDVVAYGEERGRAVYEAIKKLRERGEVVKPYGEREAARITAFRWGRDNPYFEKLMELEKRKVLQGLVKGRDYFVRLVKEPSEIDIRYGEIEYFPSRRERVVARVIDDEDSIFTPCTYTIKVLQERKDLREVHSFRGRFTEQARKGEKVLLEGATEKVVAEEVFLRFLMETERDIFIPL